MDQPETSASVSQIVRPMLPGTGSLLKETWSDYAQRFWTYIGITFIPALATFIFMAIFAGGAILGSKSGNSSYLLGGGIVLAIVAIIAVFIIGLWSSVATLYAMVHSGERVGIKESFRQTWGKLGSYFWIALISGIITVGGFMLFAIPGIIFSMWFIFALLIFINEGDRGFQALLKSREYVRNYWWAVFGRILLIGLIAFGIYLIVIIGSTIAAVMAKSDSQIFSLALQLIQQVVQILITPFILLFEVKIYMRLKELKGQVMLGTPQLKKDKKLIAWLTVLGFLMIPLATVLLILAVRP